MLWDLEVKTALKVLILEDSPGQRDKYREDFERRKWKVTPAYTSDDALKKIQEVQYAKEKFDVLAFDCVIGTVNDSGIRLAMKVADKDSDQRILVYTTQGPSIKMDYAFFAKELASRRISFMKVAGNENEEGLPLELAIWATWKGFLIFSPTPAFYLPDAIARNPDPLENLDWYILKALHRFPDDRGRAAKVANTSEPNLNRRLRDKIKPTLTRLIFETKRTERPSLASGESLEAPEPLASSHLELIDEEHEKITDETVRIFVSWYLENRVKYCRD